MMGRIFVAGLVFVGGLLASEYSFALTATLSETWNVTYGNSLDEDAEGVASDSDGNVYITATRRSDDDIVTAKYDPVGVLQWVAVYSGTGGAAAADIVVDSNQNVYVGGSVGGNFLLIKYNSAGTQLWATISDKGGTEATSQIAVDSTGNIYLAGVKFVPTTYGVLSKYNSNGIEQWSTQLSSGSYLWAIAVSSSGSIAVAGYETNSGYRDFTVRKYSSSGANTWSNTYSNGASFNDEAFAVAIASGGEVYVSGKSQNSSNYDFATIKYTSGGTRSWVKRFNSGGTDLGQVVTFDSIGNVYVSGASGAQVTTIKYSSGGSTLWSASVSAAGAIGLAVDQFANLVVGTTAGPVKYSSSGTQISFGSAGFTVEDMAVAPYSHVYLVGDAFITSNDLRTAKYTTGEWALLMVLNNSAMQ